MNPDNFTQPSTPEEPNTPLVPQSEPQPQPQPVPTSELEPTSVPPAFVAQAPATSLAAPTTQAAPKAASHKVLAIWTLVMNLIYFCLPFIVMAIFLVMSIYFVATSSEAGRDFIASLLMYTFLMFGFFAVTLLAGIAAFVLDIVYLVKAQPTGAKKVFTIISLSLFGLTLLGGLMATNFN